MPESGSGADPDKYPTPQDSAGSTGGAVRTDDPVPTGAADAQRARHDLDALTSAFAAIEHGIALFDPERRLHLCNPAFRRLLSLDARHAAPGSHQRSILLALLRRGVFQHARGEMRAWLQRLSDSRQPGQVVPLDVRLTGGRRLAVTRSTFGPGWSVLLLVDTTHVRRREQALKESERRFRELADATFEGIVIHDRGAVTDANRAFLTLVGRRLDEVIGSPLARLLKPAALAEMDPTQTSGVREIEIERADGSTFSAEVRSRELRCRGRAIQVLAIRDISRRKAIEARIRQMAEHDPLTGLPNRVLFQDRLQQGLAHSRRSGKLLALLQLDLDHFKSVNDIRGHAAGDHLLKVVAERLKRCVRETDTVARLGGDEFVVLMSGLGAAEDAGVLAQKIVAALEDPIDHQGYAIHTGTSIGITLFPLDTGLRTDAAEQGSLLKNADIALHHAKQDGRGTYRFFAPVMRAAAERRRSLERELRHALARDEFVPVFQPQFALAQPVPTGVEALLRWRHPSRGLLAPDNFLDVAEETGLIVPIGLAAMRAACREARRWQDEGLPFGRLALNLAPPELKGGRFDRTLQALLDETGLNPERVQLEITEPVFVERGLETVAATLERLAAMGIEMALDDFGTGCASFTHLKRFPLHQIKIDASFIREVGRGREDAAIVRTIVALGHSLGLGVVAKGVETEAQIAFLRAERCDAAQGYLLGRPVPARAILKLLRAGRARATAELLV